MKRKPTPKTIPELNPKPVLPSALYEAEVPEGLEAITRDEIIKLLGKNANIHKLENGAVRFSYDGKLYLLLKLQTAISVQVVLYFPVPRPKALLGHEHFQKLLKQIQTIRELSAPSAYKTLYISAAGQDTSVMTRLKQELTTQTGLIAAPDKGDLWIRLRRSREGWEALIRLTPRPLATRAWRVCNWEGALNGAVARAMALITQPNPEDIFLNIGCGSGSLLIERLGCAPAQHALGCDIDEAALRCADENLKAAGYRANLFLCDARALPFADDSVDALCADLPFGQLVGTHRENVTLYPQLLREAARVARQGARFVLITHEVRLMDALLQDSADWSVNNMLRIALGGLHPRIYMLRKN